MNFYARSLQKSFCVKYVFFKFPPKIYKLKLIELAQWAIEILSYGHKDHTFWIILF